MALGRFSRTHQTRAWLTSALKGQTTHRGARPSAGSASAKQAWSVAPQKGMVCYVSFFSLVVCLCLGCSHRIIWVFYWGHSATFGSSKLPRWSPFPRDCGWGRLGRRGHLVGWNQGILKQRTLKTPCDRRCLDVQIQYIHTYIGYIMQTRSSYSAYQGCSSCVLSRPSPAPCHPSADPILMQWRLEFWLVQRDEQSFLSSWLLGISHLFDQRPFWRLPWLIACCKAPGPPGPFSAPGNLVSSLSDRDPLGQLTSSKQRLSKMDDLWLYRTKKYFLNDFASGIESFNEAGWARCFRWTHRMPFDSQLNARCLMEQRVIHRVSYSKDTTVAG